MEDDDWNIIPGRGMGPLELDLDRDSILERLTAADIVVHAPDDEPNSIELEDGDLALTLTDEEPHRLIQILVSDDRAVVNGKPVIDRRLIEVLDEWGISTEDTLWRHDPSHNDDPRGAMDAPTQPVSERQLLINGTLWVRSYGIGLELFRGEVEQLFVRLPEHVPARGLGPLTEPQRDLLSQPDLSAALEPPKPPRSSLVGAMQTLLTIACVVTVGVIAWQGTQFQQRWNNAIPVDGTVVAVNPPPPAFWPDELTVEYTDGAGKTHQVVWNPADVYTTNAVGQTVKVHYLPEAPDKPLGPARVRDAAFLVYVPYGIGAVAIYLMLTVMLHGGVMIARKLVPADSSVAE